MGLPRRETLQLWVATVNTCMCVYVRIHARMYFTRFHIINACAFLMSIHVGLKLDKNRYMFF